jgi:hypothetical protein
MAKVTFTTLNVPLLIGKGFGGDNLNFRIMAGPVYSYVLDKNQSFSDNVTALIQLILAIIRKAPWVTR